MKRAILFFTLLVAIIFAPVYAFAQDTKLPTLQPPNLAVSIPGIQKLQPVTCAEGTCAIPWLAQYIVGLQRYGVGIVGLIAVIALMIGGIMWLVSAGNTSTIAEAKKIMGGAILGMLLMLISYTILNLINPNLTVLKSLNVSRVERFDLGEIELVGHDPQFSATDGEVITSTKFDTTFKNFAACIGVDWRLLKGIAYKESHLSSSVVNSAGFTGLFQTKDIYCAESMRALGLSSSLCNASVKDPAVNTAVATAMIKTNLASINSLCPGASESVKIFMIYYGHSSGGGALRKAIKKYTCSAGNWPNNIFKGATKDYVTETVNTVLGQGVQNVSNSSGNGSCPK